jgi:hypothetical protein
MIGDTWTDIEEGHRAGTPSVLVQPGDGAETAAQVEDSTLGATDRYPDHIASDILRAVNWSLEKIVD